MERDISGINMGWYAILKKEKLMKIKLFSSLIFVLLLAGCKSIATPPTTPTQIIPSSTSTLTPTKTKTPEPTFTATPTPSILEEYNHALAFSEKEYIHIVDENGNKILSIKSSIGWIHNFSFSPNGNNVIFSILDKKSNDFVYYDYGLYYQTIGKITYIKHILPSDVRIVFADWVSNDQIIVVTLDETFLWSSDGTKQSIEYHYGLFQDANNSIFGTETSPDGKNAIISERKYLPDDNGYGSLVGNRVFNLDFLEGTITEITNGPYCIYTRLPDERYISKSCAPDEYGNYVIQIWDTKDNQVIYTHDGFEPVWSSDQKYLTFEYRKIGFEKSFSFMIINYSLQDSKIVFDYSSSMIISDRKWSPDNRFLMFRENRSFFVVDMNDLTSKRVLSSQMYRQNTIQLPGGRQYQA